MPRCKLHRFSRADFDFHAFSHTQLTSHFPNHSFLFVPLFSNLPVLGLLPIGSHRMSPVDNPPKSVNRSVAALIGIPQGCVFTTRSDPKVVHPPPEHLTASAVVAPSTF